jgi:hypothetical protein
MPLNTLIRGAQSLFGVTQLQFGTTITGVFSEQNHKLKA